MTHACLLIACMLLPLAGALVISRLDSKPNVREAVTLVTSSALLLIVIYLFQTLDTTAGGRICDC